MAGGGECCCTNHKPALRIASSLAELMAQRYKTCGRKQKNVCARTWPSIEYDIFCGNNSCICVNLGVLNGR